MWTFEWNHILDLFYDGVFSFTKVCIILPIAMVFIMFFITTVCFYDFCKTVLQLVRKNTHLAKVWFDFPYEMSQVFNTLAFMW